MQNCGTDLVAALAIDIWVAVNFVFGITFGLNFSKYNMVDRWEGLILFGLITIEALICLALMVVIAPNAACILHTGNGLGILFGFAILTVLSTGILATLVCFITRLAAVIGMRARRHVGE